MGLIDKKLADRAPAAGQVKNIQSSTTACLELKQSFEKKQAEGREVLNFDPKNDDDSTVAKRKENIARLNKEGWIMIVEYKKTCSPEN